MRVSMLIQAQGALDIPLRTVQISQCGQVRKVRANCECNQGSHSHQ
jgi:hypothetical protein